jgi:hypothetical protein
MGRSSAKWSFGSLADLGGSRFIVSCDVFGFPLCHLCDLCASVVDFTRKHHHKDTENTEDAQRISVQAA